jgi:hypothetical protein
MAHLVFCATREGMERRITQRRAENGMDPYVIRKGSDIRGAIEALKADRDLVANAHAAAVGWHAPDGVTVELDEDMQDPRLEALWFQSEARVHRAHIAPVRAGLLLPSLEVDGKIADALKRKVEDPFLAVPVTGQGVTL